MFHVRNLTARITELSLVVNALFFLFFSMTTLLQLGVYDELLLNIFLIKVDKIMQIMKEGDFQLLLKTS